MLSPSKKLHDQGPIKWYKTSSSPFLETPLYPVTNQLLYAGSMQISTKMFGNLNKVTFKTWDSEGHQ